MTTRGMDLVLERCSTVIVGAWNLAIFSPEWVGKRLFADEPEFQFGFDVTPGAGPISHYRSSQIHLAVSAGKLELKPLSQEDRALHAIEEAARSILGILPETPIGACGINFGFDLDADSPIADVFALSDAAALGRRGAVVSSTRIARAIDFDGSRFNFTVERVAETATVRADFNFHHQVRSAQEAIKLLDGNAIRSRDVSRRFVDEVYQGTGALT